jgi:hypothetical protein
MSTVMTTGMIIMMTRVDESPVYLNIVIHIMQSRIGTQLLDMPLRLDLATHFSPQIQVEIAPDTSAHPPLTSFSP